MPGTAARVRVSEKQLAILEELSRSRTEAKGIVQRASILVLGFQGLLNEQIAVEVGLNRQQVGIWRQRWREAWDSLCVWECTEPHRLREAILEVLSDAPRPGSPAKFTAEQVAQIVALACEPPKLSGRPITRWTLRELRDEVIKREIVASISVAQVGRFLQQAAVQPHRKKMWLNTTEKDPEKFQAEVEKVCANLPRGPAQGGGRRHPHGERGRGDLAAGHRAERPRQARPTRQRGQAGIRIHAAWDDDADRRPRRGDGEDRLPDAGGDPHRTGVRRPHRPDRGHRSRRRMDLRGRLPQHACRKAWSNSSPNAAALPDPLGKKTIAAS